MSEMERQLARLERAVAAQGCPVLGALRPGIGKSALESVVRAGDVPQDVVELFAWRNGTDLSRGTLGELWILPGFYLLSYEEGVARTRSTQQTGQRVPFPCSHLEREATSWFVLRMNPIVRRQCATTQRTSLRFKWSSEA